MLDLGDFLLCVNHFYYEPLDFVRMHFGVLDFGMVDLTKNPTTVKYTV